MHIFLDVYVLNTRLETRNMFDKQMLMCMLWNIPFKHIEIKEHLEK